MPSMSWSPPKVFSSSARAASSLEILRITSTARS
jgi:hypothetical protein